MKRIVVVTVCLMSVLVGCTSKQQPQAVSAQTPYEMGKSEAQASLSQNKLGWKQYGQPMAHDNLFKQVLKEDYNIDLLIVAGCRVTEDLIQNVKGYNEIMKAEIMKRLQKDVISLAEAKAKQQFEDQRKNK